MPHPRSSVPQCWDTNSHALSPCPGYFPSLPAFKQTFPGSASRLGHCTELFSPCQRQGGWFSPAATEPLTPGLPPVLRTACFGCHPSFCAPKRCHRYGAGELQSEEKPHTQGSSGAHHKKQNPTCPASAPHNHQPELKWCFQHRRRERCLTGLWEQQGAAFPPPWKQGHPFCLVG